VRRGHRNQLGIVLGQAAVMQEYEKRKRVVHTGVAIDDKQALRKSGATL
jgi:hypothetical protein